MSSRCHLSLLCGAALLLAVAPGCEDGDDTGTGDGGASDASALGDGGYTGGDGGSTGGDGGSTWDAGWHSGECVVTACQQHTYQCGDCEDNDQDGLIDSQDPDCLGPCDNNEQGFNTLIPGGNVQPCAQECYFDQDNGPGNDQCYWDHRCDSLQPQAH